MYFYNVNHVLEDQEENRINSLFTVLFVFLMGLKD